jgi:hypothetical protein
MNVYPTPSVEGGAAGEHEERATEELLEGEPHPQLDSALPRGVRGERPPGELNGRSRRHRQRQRRRDAWHDVVTGTRHVPPPGERHVGDTSAEVAHPGRRSPRFDERQRDVELHRLEQARRREERLPEVCLGDPRALPL